MLEDTIPPVDRVTLIAGDYLDGRTFWKTNDEAVLVLWLYVQQVDQVTDWTTDRPYLVVVTRHFSHLECYLVS